MGEPGLTIGPSMSMKVGVPVCTWFGEFASGFVKAALACAARTAALEDRRANRAAQGRFFSAHLEHGTLLSQPVFAFAQF